MKPTKTDILDDLARAKALFQARTIAAVLGVAPPAPETFRRETGK